MMIRPIVLLTLVIVMLAEGCGQRPSVVYDYNIREFDYDVVEAGDHFSLSMADLQKALVESRLLPRGGVVDVATIEWYLDSLVTDTLAGLKAAGVRLEDYRRQFHLYKLRLHGLLTRRYFEEMVYNRVTIDSQEVREIVHANPELFTAEEHVLLYQIMIAAGGLLRSPDSARYTTFSEEQLEREAERLAFEAHEKALATDSFPSVAREYSQDIYTRDRGGLVGWTPRGKYYDPFDSIAFSMKAGEISQPYRDRDGWHILYIADHVPAGLAPVDKFFDFISHNALTI
ncbi:MAG: peptidylprolyl isomerase, partial [candidate division Zixibacteria bacterium]|nr:peptidylprolyl isomerase [candidate division Zixibacteria bacterium]